MDIQSLLNLGISCALACLGWFARQLWEATQKLKEDLKRIEVDLPTSYVTKVDIQARFDRLEAILDKLFEKLEKKADK
jgi:chaperonin cofactor prefoldin